MIAVLLTTHIFIVQSTEKYLCFGEKFTENITWINYNSAYQR